MTTTPRQASVLATLRALIPNRPLYYSQAVQLTELQANRLRRALNISSPEVPDEALAAIPRVRVVELDDLPSSGVSQWTRGTWVIAINGHEPWQRQRFTLAHELWHVINFPTERWLCEPGPFRDRAEKRELLADYFAGCLLMPKQHLKLLVGQGFTVDQLADTFGVSERAVKFRLVQVGLQERRPRCAGPPASAMRNKNGRHAGRPSWREVAA